MSRAFHASALLSCLLVAISIDGLAQESRITSAPITQSSFSGTEVALWLLVASLLTLAAYLARTTRQRQRTLAAINRDLRQQVIELKRAGETLSRLAPIVEASYHPLICKTIDGVIVSWNPSAERIYGHSQQEMIGQSISVLVPID